MRRALIAIGSAGVIALLIWTFVAQRETEPSSVASVPASVPIFTIASGALPGPTPHLLGRWDVSAVIEAGEICLRLELSTGGKHENCGSISTVQSGIEFVVVSPTATYHEEGTWVTGMASLDVAEVAVEAADAQTITVSTVGADGFPVRFFAVLFQPRIQTVPEIAAYDSRGRVLARQRASKGGSPAYVPDLVQPRS